MKKLQEKSAEERALDAIAVHASSLQEIAGETTRSEMHAEVCTARQIALRDQKLRSFVIKNSVIEIHCVVVFAMMRLCSCSERFAYMPPETRSPHLL